MNWKDLMNSSEEFLNDPSNISHFSLREHPEFPNLSKLDENEVLEILTDFLKAENQAVTIKNLLNYAPFYEMILSKSNMPSIYG